jgi:hypothetical protein
VYRYKIFFIYSSVNACIGCFLSSATWLVLFVNMGVQESLLYNSYIGVILRDGMSGSYGSSILSFLRNLHNDIHRIWINLYPHQWCTRGTFSLNHHQHLLLFVLLMIVILIEVRWCLSFILIYVLFRAKNVEHIFIYIGYLYFLYWELSVQSTCHLLIGIFI